MTHVLLLNVLLFLPVALGGLGLSLFGYRLVSDHGRPDDGREPPPRRGPSPGAPWPVEPCRRAGRDELARSA